MKTPKILCIDDDPTFLLLYKKYLKEEGFEVKVGKSAEEGMELLNDFSPDMIISDMVMPGMSGLDFCKTIRNIPKYSSIIFLLVSALKTNAEDAVSGLEGGADDYIIKPFDKSNFLAKIKAFLRINQLQNKLSSSNKTLENTLEKIKIQQSELEIKNKELVQEKENINASYKQISIMAQQLEDNNKKLESSAHQQQHNLHSTINILSTLIEGRRQGHRGHAKTVAEISSYIAKKMELGVDYIRDVETASLLHEIGKFGIPDSLALKRPSEYTNQEKDILSQHPFRGAELLEDFEGFEGVALMIKHFHEKYDGSGYPDRLAGKAIPVGSRIISVSNFYENIVYRSDIEDPFPLLDKNAGILYDPSIINYLRQYVSEFKPEMSSPTRQLTIYELESGMEIIQDIYTKSGIKLVPRDTVLDKDAIERISKYNKIDPLEDHFYVKG
ncbi:MAG: response regulator [Candidatus Marinimicrobia bacterium]|nr:response regulator [Candidatus Neomarinimicrobiota bacterium]